jgi:hypothetical protein
MTFGMTFPPSLYDLLGLVSSVFFWTLIFFVSFDVVPEDYWFIMKGYATSSRQHYINNLKRPTEVISSHWTVISLSTYRFSNAFTEVMKLVYSLWI